MSNAGHGTVCFDEGFSEATRRAYASDWKSFQGWALSSGSNALPASPDSISAYIEHLSTTHRPASVARHLATIACVHRDKGLPPPTTQRSVKVAMKRMWRKGGRRQRQALAITHHRREEMQASAPDTLRGRRDKALVAVAYDLGCRRSELVSLMATDIDRAEDGSGTILLRRSKTDQEGMGSVRYLAPSTIDAIDAWMDAARVEEGTIFRSIDRFGAVGSGLTGGSVSRIYKRMSREAGHEESAVRSTSGHSTRVGMAQDMATAGVDLAGIMQAGNWKSPTMVARYIERLTAKNGAAARLAKLQGR
jgi:site-specific recombinase XerD